MNSTRFLQNRFQANLVWSRIAFLGIAFTAVSSLVADGPVLQGQETAKSNEIDYPLVVINAAGVQRLRDNAGFLFETAQRPEMVDAMDKWMVSFLKETKGVDRSKPFGMMLYLPPTFFGPPVGISYIPVTNVDDTLATLAYGTGTVSPVDGKAGRYEITYGQFKMRARHKGDYLFLVGPDGDEETLERNFPDPVKLTSRLTSQYDIAVSLLIKSVPPGIKLVFVEFLKTSAQAEMQQRDDEPESAYRLRRANLESWLELADRIVSQGEELTIGGRLNAEKKIGTIEFEIAGTPDSKLAKFFQDMAGKRTYFGNLIQDPATLTMSLSWLLNPKQKTLFVQLFETAKKELSERSAKAGVEGLGPIMEPIFKSLLASADAGHIDTFVQMTGEEPGKFALIGGAKLIATKNLPQQMTDLLQFVKDNPNGSTLATQLDLTCDTIDSHPVHRLPINPPDKPGQRMFGESAYLYFYASPQAVWFAFGGDSALKTLKDAIAKAALPQDPEQNRNRVPFQFVTHARNWLSVAENETPRQVTFNELSRASFEPDNDTMRLDIRPTDSGVRLRFEFQEGFLALMGRGISKGIDDGVFNRPPGGPRGRRGRPGGDAAPPDPKPPVD